MSTDSKPFEPVSRRYSSPGFCIYCFKAETEGKLTDEHFWPESLYGYDTILKASCLDCAAKLTRVDGYLARHVYYKLRLRCGYRSKRKNSKNHPTSAITPYMRNGKPAGVRTPIKDAGFSIALPKYPPPGILVGKPPTEFFGSMALECHRYFDEVLPYIESSPGDRIIFYDAPRVDPLKFAKGMAKIAYGAAVAGWGIERFRDSRIPEILLHDLKQTPYFVGSPPGPTPPFEDSGNLHQTAFLVLKVLGINLLVVRIRPFFTYGSYGNGFPMGFPIYDVVVGTVTDFEAKEGPRPKEARA